MQEFRDATLADAVRCFEIETNAYEGDEAATLDKITKRIGEYPQGFLILEIAGDIVGFINSSCAHEVILSDENFKEMIGHEPTAPNVVIMSVVVDPEHQGKGYSTALMQEFVEKIVGMGKKTIHLICKRNHIPLYEKFGYRYRQPSASEHGGARWHEMIMHL
jgi:GNAT superfamily N-acetyltransferase